MDLAHKSIGMTKEVIGSNQKDVISIQ